MNAPRHAARWVVALLVSGLLSVALPIGCSSGGSSATGSGGAVGSGGVSSSGGSTGSSSGGATASGGVSGGMGSGGSSSGGATATGGSTGSGGTTAAGGTTSSGGMTNSGRATSSGGGAGGVPGGGGSIGNGGRTGGGGRGGMTTAGGRTGGGGGAGGTALSMTLTSPVLTEGAAFPASITCADANMGSPELDWTAGPSGTMSYAVTLTDLTNNLVHWAIWNLPSTVTMLPAGLATTATLTTPNGAHQLSFNGTGYTGPCPSGTTHTYEFRVYAISVATLPGSNPTSTSTAKTSIIQNALAEGTLTGTSDAKKM